MVHNNKHDFHLFHSCSSSLFPFHYFQYISSFSVVFISFRQFSYFFNSFHSFPAVSMLFHHFHHFSPLITINYRPGTGSGEKYKESLHKSTEKHCDHCGASVGTFAMVGLAVLSTSFRPRGSQVRATRGNRMRQAAMQNGGH